MSEFGNERSAQATRIRLSIGGKVRPVETNIKETLHTCDHLAPGSRSL